jgi:molybdopterin-binding protein
MRRSTRDHILGTIKTAKPGATTTHVTIEVSPIVMITPSITNEASSASELNASLSALAVFEASGVGV